MPFITEFGGGSAVRLNDGALLASKHQCVHDGALLERASVDGIEHQVSKIEVLAGPTGDGIARVQFSQPLQASNGARWLSEHECFAGQPAWVVGVDTRLASDALDRESFERRGMGVHLGHIVCSIGTTPAQRDQVFVRLDQRADVGKGFSGGAILVRDPHGQLRALAVAYLGTRGLADGQGVDVQYIIGLKPPPAWCDQPTPEPERSGPPRQP